MKEDWETPDGFIDLGYIKLPTIYKYIQENKLDILQKYIDNGLVINKSNFEGVTPLTFACMCNNNKSIKFLLSKGADPNLLNNNGISPIYELAQSRHIINIELSKKNIKLLLDYGLDKYKIDIGKLINNEYKELILTY